MGTFVQENLKTSFSEHLETNIANRLEAIRNVKEMKNPFFI